MKKRARIIVTAAVALLAVVAGAVWAMQPLAVDAAVVEAQDNTVTYSEQGTYTYQSYYTLYPVITGEVTSVAAEVGDEVLPGSVLASVDASDIDAQIAQLESSIVGYQGQITALDQQEQQRKEGLEASKSQAVGQLAVNDAEKAAGLASNTGVNQQITIQAGAVSQAQAVLTAAQAALAAAVSAGIPADIAAAQAAVDQAQATLSAAQLQLAQLQGSVVDAGVYDVSHNALSGQIAELDDQLGKDFSGGMKTYYQAQICAAKEAIANLESKAGKAEVTCQVAGVVTELPILDKNVIQPGEPAAVIGVGPCVEVFVPVREIGGIEAGLPVELTLDQRSGDVQIDGEVFFVGSEAVTKVSALGVDEQRMRVLVRPADNKALKAGYNLDVQFLLSVQEATIEVPKGAVYQDGGADYVWLIADGKLEQRQVQLGTETRSGYILESGLQGGETVVQDANNPDLAAGKAATIIGN